MGHSLGAGCAALLSLLLKADYPSVRALAVSPPGGLVSEGACREASREPSRGLTGTGTGNGCYFLYGCCVLVFGMSRVLCLASRVLYNLSCNTSVFVCFSWFIFLFFSLFSFLFRFLLFVRGHGSSACTVCASIPGIPGMSDTYIHSCCSTNNDKYANLPGMPDTCIAVVHTLFFFIVLQATEAMVTSIVLNDDVVPRMSAQSIEALADQVSFSLFLFHGLRYVFIIISCFPCGVFCSMIS